MRLFAPVEQLLHVRVEIQGALALFDRIFEYLDLPVEIQDAPDAIHLRADHVRGRVSFRNISFAYKSDRPAAVGANEAQALDIRSRRSTLHEVSFEIQPGQLAALVGPSGAGKTTVTYLLARLYDADSGSIEIDGRNVKQIARASPGQLIGAVTQETHLFYTSIREYLLFARPDATSPGNHRDGNDSDGQSNGSNAWYRAITAFIVTTPSNVLMFARLTTGSMGHRCRYRSVVSSGKSG